VHLSPGNRKCEQAPRPPTAPPNDARHGNRGTRTGAEKRRRSICPERPRGGGRAPAVITGLRRHRLSLRCRVGEPKWSELSPRLNTALFSVVTGVTRVEPYNNHPKAEHLFVHSLTGPPDGTDPAHSTYRSRDRHSFVASKAKNNDITDANQTTAKQKCTRRQVRKSRRCGRDWAAVVVWWSGDLPSGSSSKRVR